MATDLDSSLKILALLGEQQRVSFKEAKQLTGLDKKALTKLIQEMLEDFDGDLVFHLKRQVLTFRIQDNRAKFQADEPWSWFGHRPDWVIAQALEITQEEVFETRQRLRIEPWVEYLPRNLEGYQDSPMIPGVKLTGAQLQGATPGLEDSYEPLTYLTDKVYREPKIYEEFTGWGLRYFIEDHAGNTNMSCDKVGWHTIMWVVALKDQGKA